MNKIKIFFLSILLIGLFIFPMSVSAQNYRFEVTVMEVEAYIEEDGTLSLWYLIEFQNRTGADPIDFVDIGMPSSAYSLNAIQAEVNGKSISKIESSPYVPNGFALELGADAIQPGQSGTVTAWIPGIRNVLSVYDGPDRENYTNFQFSPTWFDPDFEKSNSTEYRVTIILPPGVGDDEGVYYEPQRWPGSTTPDDTGRTADENRVYYSWFTNNANAHTQYIFGAAFPTQYIPEDTHITQPPQITQPGIVTDRPGAFTSLIRVIAGNFCCFGFGIIFFAIFVFSFYQSAVGANKRKMAYLPPKMKIEGNGIKRGLTAVEAAILMEQPMDKILTMILFGVLKKEVATVIQHEPLELEVVDTLPEGLHPYEADFLTAFKQPGEKKRTALQKMMVDMVNSVSKKMKGFSHKETVAYYEDIISRAWKMVEDSDTPEVKSERYNQTMEWTMLDSDYQERTRRTFTTGPVFVPIWWPRYSPTYRRNIGGTLSNPVPVQSTTTSPGGKVSLPNIPGSNFAAGVINGVTGMAAGVVGNLTSFTSGVTTRTNPIPTTSRSGSGGFRGGGGGGSSCACACACAGCACACAGGGR
jgi:hypothetical protein